MNRLAELIAELCPDGVPFKKVKEVYSRIKGTPITAGKMKEIENPNGNIRIFAGGKTVIDAMEEDIPNANITRVPAVLVQSRGVIDVVYYEKPFTFKNEMWAYTCPEKASIKYLYYVLKNNIQKFRDAASGMGSLPQISLPVTEEFEIPVPPLPVQREIVRILDSFTELTAELTAELTTELTARQKQNNHYISSLLSGTDNKYRLVELGTVAKFIYGYTDKAQDVGNVRFVRITDILDNGTLNPINAKYVSLSPESQKYLLRAGDIVMARTGATYGKTLYIPDDTPSVFASFLIKIQLDNSKILNRFYWHFAQSSMYWEQAKKLVSTGGQPQFNTGAISKVKVPIPSIEDQKKIIHVLDKFDTIWSSIRNGLPDEIAARQKQYEYYRNRLLTLKRKEN